MAAPVDPGTFTDHTPALADAVDARFAPLFTTLDGNVDTDSIADGVATPALLSPISWQSVPIVNGIGGTLDFFKDHLGFVRLRQKAYTHGGSVTLTPGETVFTLPPGYRPGTTIYLRLNRITVGAGSSALGTIAIFSNGVAIMNCGEGVTSSMFHVILGFWLAEG
jgi:hypothetical protein